MKGLTPCSPGKHGQEAEKVLQSDSLAVGIFDGASCTPGISLLRTGQLTKFHVGFFSVELYLMSSSTAREGSRRILLLESFTIDFVL
jgi:hypothetical protein